MISTGSHVGTTALAERPAFRLVLAVTLSAVVVSACASSSPATTSLEPQRVTRVTRGDQTVEIFAGRGGIERLVAAPVESVWLVLPVVYDRLEIPVGVSDPGQRTFGNLGYRAHQIGGERLSLYLNCGRGMGGPYADQHSVTLAVLTRLTEAEGGTMVVTTVDGSARPRAVSGVPGACATKSRLELRLAQLIVEVLEGEEPVDTTLSQTDAVKVRGPRR